MIVFHLCDEVLEDAGPRDRESMQTLLTWAEAEHDRAFGWQLIISDDCDFLAWYAQFIMSFTPEPTCWSAGFSDDE